MSLHFPYQLETARHAVVSLGGRWVRPRPVISVTLIGPKGTYVADAQLDPASDDTVFSETVAGRIGLDLSKAPIGRAAGIGMVSIPLRFAQATIRITDGREQREWLAWVAFASARLRRPLLGFAGFLQFFTARFAGDREEVELTVNSLYQGT